MNDQEAYELYPEDNWVYDKAEIAAFFKVRQGLLIPDDAEYCVKPRTNLEGCSIGSKFVRDLKGFTVPEGFCWFEKLEGIHWTCDFVKTEENGWLMTNPFKGVPYSKDHKRFQYWERLKSGDVEWFDMNACVSVLHNIKKATVVNFEFIGGKAIECHLRGNTDPIEYDLIIPDWEGIYRNKEEMKEKGFIYLKDKENHPGRKGFWAK